MSNTSKTPMPSQNDQEMAFLIQADIDGELSPVAALVYAAGPHLIDLYVWPASTPFAESSGERSGYNYVRWQQDGMQFWAVSDLAADELVKFVRDWRKA